MPQIRIEIREKIARQTDNGIYVCGNSDFEAVFSFDTEWDAYPMKTARFKYNGGYQDVVFTGDTCAVPVIQDTYSFKVGVYAGDLHTTTAALISATKSILCGDEVHREPTKDVYGQIMDVLNETMRSVAADADSAKKSAAAAAVAGGDAVSAKNAAETAQDKAESARDGARTAQTAAEAAQAAAEKAAGEFADDMKQLFTSVSNGKAAVASAITDKGVPTAKDAAFVVMAENIRNIPIPQNYGLITYNGHELTIS